MYCRSRTSIRRRCLAGFALFEPDRLHLNRAGYLLRRALLAPAATALCRGGARRRHALSLWTARDRQGRHGATLAQVIKCTVMLADIGEWAAMNEVYVTFFPKHLPARSAFGTTGLALGARLELECVAVLPETG